MKFWIGAKDPHVHRAMNSRCETAKPPDAYEQQLCSELLSQSVGRMSTSLQAEFQLFDSQQINQTLCPTAEFHLILITAQGLVLHPVHVTEKDPEILLWSGR